MVVPRVVVYITDGVVESVVADTPGIEVGFIVQDEYFEGGTLDHKTDEFFGGMHAFSSPVDIPIPSQAERLVFGE